MRFLKIFLITLLGIFLFSCGGKKETKQLSASIFPLSWLVKEIYPSYEVYQIIKPGSNPHIYELTPSDIRHIKNSLRVFVIGNLEPFVGKIDKDKLVEAIKILNIPPSANPHIWLSPKRWLELAQKLPKEVKGLKEDAQSYEKTISRLQKLDKEYSVLTTKGYKVVMIHPAFYWLCKDYGMKILYVLEKGDSGLQISLKRFNNLVELLKKEKELNKVLLLYSSTNEQAKKVAQRIKQLFPSIRVVELDPLIWETEGDYITLMEKNLKKLLSQD